jgi:hypothetical protein
MIESKSEIKSYKKTYAFKQINLFTKKIRRAYLVAWDSPRKAFYRIWIEVAEDEYTVVKESGIKGKVLDRRSWPTENFEAAKKQFQRRIKSKVNPDRKSPRKYMIVHQTNEISTTPGYSQSA